MRPELDESDKPGEVEGREHEEGDIRAEVGGACRDREPRELEHRADAEEDRVGDTEEGNEKRASLACGGKEHVEGPGDSNGDLTEASEQIIVPLSPKRYPSLMRFTAEHGMKPGYDFGDSFEAGLGYVLEGVERAASGAVQAGRDLPV